MTDLFNILIIDRQRNNRQKIRHYLEDLKYDYRIVGEVSTPSQGQRLLTGRSVDLIIGEDGVAGSKTSLQLFKDYQDLMPNLHGVLLTDSPMFSQSMTTMAGGRLDYLQLPVKKNDLISSVRKMAMRIEDAQAKANHQLSLRENYEDQRHTFREGFLMNLIYGSLRQNAYIYNQLDHFTIPYGSTFIAAVFKIDDYRRYQLALEEDERQFMIFRVFSLLQQGMKADNAGIAFISRHDEVTLLYTAMDEQLDVLDHCTGFHELIHDALDLQGTIGIGRAYEDPKDIHLSYNQAVDAVLEHDYLGKDTVIHIDYVIGKNDLAYAFGPEQETMFCRYAVSGQLDNGLKTLRKIMTALSRSEGYGPEFYQAMVTSLLSRLYRDGLAYDYALEPTVKKDMAGRVLGEVIDDQSAFTYLKDALTAITEYVKDKKVTQDQALLENALKYVQAYYTSRISLTSAAQFLMTTPKHLEDIIYSVYEKSFYDFCIMVRIENAKDLLIKSRQNTSEVASAVGFTNTEYFVAIFKQYTNLTPSEYRHQNRYTAEPPIQLIRPTTYKTYY